MPRRVIAIDPDTKLYGWAVFEGNMFVACGVEEVGRDLGLAPSGADLLVCEYPVARTKGRRVKAQDIIDLAYAAGRIVQSLAGPWSVVQLYTPMEWKGNLSKTQCHDRAKAVLRAKELTVLKAALRLNKKGVHSEILDAVSLGLYHLERTS